MAASTENSSNSSALKKALRLLSCEGLDGAMMVVDRELESNPESWEALSAKADILYFQGKYETALQYCELSMDQNPDNALVYNIKGNILYKQKKYEGAIECYNRAIEIEPLFVRAWYNKKLASEIQLKNSRMRVHCMPLGKSGEKVR
ncbi:Tetratricopeptide repeat protein [uncultured archaeon]|nr:Tetratricopeptide repeat protein [uncultured archaeon]